MNERETKPQQPPMEPWEVYDQVLERGEAVKLARLMSCSPQLIRAFCRAPETTEDYTDTGRRSDLERIGMIIDHIAVVDGTTRRAYPFGHYLAAKLGGIFVPLRRCLSCHDSEAVLTINSVMKETAEAIEHIRRNWFEDVPQKFTREQSKQTVGEIREAMAALHQAEQFVLKHTECNE